jgi:hypothetical protein
MMSDVLRTDSMAVQAKGPAAKGGVERQHQEQDAVAEAALDVAHAQYSSL